MKLFGIIIVGISALLVIGIIIVMVVALKNPSAFAKNRFKENNVGKDGHTSQNQGPTSANSLINDVKDFVPFKGIEDYAIDLGHYNYRAIIDVSSLNYNLLTEQEKEIVEVSYQRFLNSISFPIELYVQTREYDRETMLNELESKIKDSVEKFPQIKEYTDEYFLYMQHLTDITGNSKTKKKFVIVPYNSSDLTNMSQLNDYELKEFILAELKSRCSIVIAGLQGVGLTATLLDREGIAECLYSYYHRDSYNVATDLARGYFSTLFVSGETKQVDENLALEVLIKQAQQNITTEVNKKDTSKDMIKLYELLYEKLDEFRLSTNGVSVKEFLDTYNSMNNQQEEQSKPEVNTIYSADVYDGGIQEVNGSAEKSLNQESETTERIEGIMNIIPPIDKLNSINAESSEVTTNTSSEFVQTYDFGDDEVAPQGNDVNAQQLNNGIVFTYYNDNHN